MQITSLMHALFDPKTNLLLLLGQAAQHSLDESIPFLH